MKYASALKIDRMTLPLAATTVAALTGLVVSVGDYLIAGLLLALIVTVGLAMKPQWLLLAVIFGGIAIAGLCELYIPQLRQARWGVVVGCLTIGAISLATKLADPDHSRLPTDCTSRSAAVFSLIFVAVSVASSIINNSFSSDAIVGLKGYFQTWGILLAFLWLPLSLGDANRIMATLPFLSLLQLPFILHQHFKLVPLRLGISHALHGLVAQDVVVGTFAASMIGGGSRSSLLFLQGVSLAIVAARWRAGRCGTLALLTMTILYLLPLALNGLKLGILFIPIILTIVFGDRLRSKLSVAVPVAAVSAIIIPLMFVMMSMLPRTGGERALTVNGYLEEWLSYNFNDRGYGNARLNRTTVYEFWLKNHRSTGSALSTIIGHGPGTANSTNMANNSLGRTRYFGYGIDLTAISAVLWETGLLGTAAVAAVFVFLHKMTTANLVRVSIKSVEWENLKGVQAGMAMAALSLFHNSTFLYEIGFQTVLLLLAGYTAFISLQVHRSLYASR